MERYNEVKTSDIDPLPKKNQKPRPKKETVGMPLDGELEHALELGAIEAGDEGGHGVGGCKVLLVC